MYPSAIVEGRDFLKFTKVGGQENLQKAGGTKSVCFWQLILMEKGIILKQGIKLTEYSKESNVLVDKC